MCVTQEKWVRVTHLLFNQVRISDQYVKVHITLYSNMLWMDLTVLNKLYISLYDSIGENNC